MLFDRGALCNAFEFGSSGEVLRVRKNGLRGSIPVHSGIGTNEVPGVLISGMSGVLGGASGFILIKAGRDFLVGHFLGHANIGRGRAILYWWYIYPVLLGQIH